MSAKYDLEGRDEIELRSPINSDMKSPTEEEFASCRPCRIVFIVLFTLGLLGMLAAAIVIIATKSPSSCAKKAVDGKPFWKKEMAYQIYVHSFQDTSGDGYGDFKGIKQRLSYLDEIGAKIIVLSGFLSGNHFTDLHSNSGSLDEFKDLIAAAKLKKMSVVLDIDPTYTSSASHWFTQSRSRNSSSQYKDWYIWRTVANNWKNKAGGSAWELDTTYNKYYYYYLDNQKPMLNFNSTAVKNEFTRALTFWLDLGVKGFKLNHFRRIIVDSTFRDNNLGEMYNIDQPEVHKLLEEWNSLIKSKGGFLMGTGDDNAKTASYYGTKEKPQLDIVLSKKLTGTPSGSVSTFLNTTISEYTSTKPKYAWPGWVFDGPQYSRIANRYSDPLARRVLNLLQLTLPGSAIFYYGDELALKNFQTKSTVAMSWDKTVNGGFSRANPWYSNAPITPPTNVEDERKKNDIFKFTTDVMKLRLKEISLQSSYIKVLYAAQETIVYIRSEVGSKGFLIALNLGASPHKAVIKSKEAKKGKFVLDTLFKKKDTELNLSEIDLEGYQGFIIRIIE